MSRDPGLHWAPQQQLSPDARVTIDDKPPSEIWSTIASSEAFCRKLASAVRISVTRASPQRSAGVVLHEAGVTASGGGYAQMIADLTQDVDDPSHQHALAVTASLAQSGVTSLGRTNEKTIRDGPLAAFEAADICPTVSVVLSQRFRERSARQQREALSFLALLGTALDVRVNCSGLIAGWLRETHGPILPTSFCESVTAGGQQESPVDEMLETARREIGFEGRGVTILRQLAEEPTETLRYSALVAKHDVSKSRVSNLLTTLEDLGLVERTGTRSNKQVSLRQLGSEYLDALEADIGRQATLDSSFCETRQTDSQAVYPRGQEGPHNPAESEAIEGPHPQASPGDIPVEDTTGESTDDGVPYRTRFMDANEAVPASATGTSGEITAVDTTALNLDTERRRTRAVSYDDGRDEAVIAVSAYGPLQYAASIAVGLASPRFFDEVLPADRLEDLDISTGLLRAARCIGGLSDAAAEDPSTLRDNIVEWGEQIEEMTRQLKHEEYDDRDRFRGEIIRSAHGLAGTVVHLLDVAGVDVVRELRLPRALPDERLEDLAETVSLSAIIQSQYGHYAVFRQLLERRESKLKTAGTPSVDAADPIASLIGGIVLRGPNATRLGQHIEGILGSVREVRDDAPEISLEIPVGTPDRSAFAGTVTRLCEQKGLRPSREATTILRALTENPYSIGRAFDVLSNEESSRAIRLDEVRVALASLEDQRLLPELPAGATAVVTELLQAERPLPRAAIATRAGVSRRTVDRNIDDIVGLGLAEATENGYRLTLPFATPQERGSSIVPQPVERSTAQPVDLLFDIVVGRVDDASRLADRSDPLGEAFCWPPDYGQIALHKPYIARWIDVAKALCEVPEGDSPIVSIDARGKAPQTSIRTTTGSVAD